MYRKIICWVSLVLMLGLINTNTTFGGKIWETRISSGNDDAEEDVSGGGIDLTSSDLELFDDGGLQIIGLRFVDIPIPKGAIVDDAFVEFTCDEIGGGTQPVSAIIQGQLNPNPPTFANTTNNISNRPTTTAKVIWNADTWTEQGQKIQTSDITSIIQEIIDQADWAMGNALVLILRDNPDNPSTGLREAESASDISNAPLLHIEFRGKFAVEPVPADGSLYEDTLAVLNWMPGLNAVSHDVYFGESFVDVNDGTGDTFQGNQVEVFFTVGIAGTPVPDGLVPGTTYYWRIDEVQADGAKIRGDVWSFTVPSLKAYGHNLPDGAKFINPDTDLSWTAGSGAKLHTVYFGDNFDDVNDAVGGPSQGSTTYDPGTLESGKTYYWRVDEYDGVETYKGDVLSFTTIAVSGTGLRGDYYSGQNFDEFVLTRIDPVIDFIWADTPPDPALPNNSFSVRWTGDVSAQFTETYSFYTITDDGLRLWVDGKLIIENWTLHGDTEDSGTIDLLAGQSYSIVLEYFENTSNATARLGWQSPHTAKQIIPTYLLWPPVKAREPNPANGAADVSQTKILKWSAGEQAASHDVYFGTDAQAVGNATKTSLEYKGSKTLGDESYDPGILALNTTYYWRIDEVNDLSPDSPWTGSVWSFSTGDFVVIDDFEDYDDGDNQIWYTWHDGLGYGTPGSAPYYAGNGTGSAVGNETGWTSMEHENVHGGRQSVPFFYDNDKQGFAKYSEIEKTLDYPRDWTAESMARLSLWFYGSSANDPEPMYVAISNSTGQPAVVVNDNPSAAQIEAWTEWVIPLQSFADQGADLTDVDRIAIGFGTKGNQTIPGGRGKMLFDDIRLYRLAEAAAE